jgi:cytochrome c553
MFIARVAVALPCWVWLALSVTPCAAADDAMMQRVEPCFACHGKEGRASSIGYLPRIAGKPAGYLYAQLKHLQEGRRSNAAMALLLAPLSDAYLLEMAETFAALDLPYPPPQAPVGSAAQRARGEALVLHGDDALRIPACVHCHGSSMTGVLPDVPGLLGLPRDYLVAQLGAWRTGNRKAAAPDCMAQIAQRMTLEDIGAVASWLAARPPPADAKAALRHEAKPPLDCGSIRP